ncbi:MAG: sigma-54 dependent transcriptional regulator [Methylobacter sp.]|nr:sigma-54 dependent transcriptional regulator [Methylobacter sp.]MDP2098093.1 sigma-54 dependent transcriptional regulator [Methylobacter sp.]MDP2430063.1 sigma-54 dependent transcriptional regulator [Methylobacter sp.]MDP3056878.1 sigma-54 dependent transcriptional regulator [Methylobacter sp.]MDP3364373.1 sigma-54 dependent transcriptional regulator [Methylobacter sp.]
MKKPLALIVDDEPDIRELLEITLNRMAIETCGAEDVGRAKALLQQKPFDLCLTDMKLPDGNGLELVDFIQALPAPIPVAVITAHGNMESAILAMKKGAFDFVSKPVDLASLKLLINNALKLSDASPQKDQRSRYALLGDSPAMQDIRAKIDKLARSQAPVYISGESGSGKELVARLIHQRSARNDRAFVAINCGAIPYELMESEFFGHKKGSFTGAICDKMGFFQSAEGGTLFLDEVADLPLPLQVKLLRAIQEKKIRPVGGQQEIAVDVRLLSATHRNLGDMVQDGSFRQDLYYRINVIELHVPALRERPEDIPALVEHILLKLTGANKQDLPAVTPAALAALQRYHFPGNVRELENILERALALYEGIRIERNDLNLPGLSDDDAKSAGAEPESASLEDHLDKIERLAIRVALEANYGDKTAAAQALGLSLRALCYRLQKLGMES